MKKRFPATVPEAALLLAETYNWVVFPVPIGSKRSHKSKKYCGGIRWGATNNPKVIARDFRRWPKANCRCPDRSRKWFLGARCRHPKGHGKDDIASLRALERQYGRLPKTLVVISPSGSVHYYFRYPTDGTIIRIFDLEDRTRHRRPRRVRHGVGAAIGEAGGWRLPLR